eukprot:scaffold6614_cov51-Attheya_sp.AAC.7
MMTRASPVSLAFICVSLVSPRIFYIRWVTTTSTSRVVFELFSLDARNDFPRFSGYMGTRTTLQKLVPPDEY